MHFLHCRLLERRVRIALVGCGGLGAQLAGCLARLHLAMRELGHPYGIHLVAYDPDAVSEANIGRQVWSPSDIGRNKAVTIVHRLNLYYGLDWDACPRAYSQQEGTGFRVVHDCDLLVSCVDTAAARRELHGLIAAGYGPQDYWLDLGNTAVSGQAVFGEVQQRWERPTDTASPRLPFVTDLFPEILDASRAEDATPSCSARLSLLAQGLFLNDIVVRFAAQILYALFSEGRLAYHGVHVNVQAGRVAPIAVDPQAWARYGHVPCGQDAVCGQDTEATAAA